jgi:hypothetical protein
MMNSTIREARIQSNLKQIQALQAEKARVADGWLARGLAKTEGMIEAISEQIVNLYEEMDALEAGETKAPALVVEKADEHTPSALEVETMKRCGWTVSDLIRHNRKMARGRA